MCRSARRWVQEARKKGVGLFDPEMIQNQDDEMNQRILDHGGRIRLDPAVAPASLSLAGLTVRLALEGGGGSPASFAIPLVEGVHESDGYRVGVDRIVEIEVPAPAPAPDGSLALRILLHDAEGREMEALPAEGWLKFRTARHDWSA